MKSLEGKRILITGGTGSLGKVLTRRLLGGELGHPAKIVIFSRDEAKQHEMRMDYVHKTQATDEIIYRDYLQTLEFRIGDVRDFASISSALRDVDVVFNAAALKQVPTCEYFPFEAVMTNIAGPENIIRAIENYNLPVDTVVCISTDKACKPVNVMGMTKAIQERVFVNANMRCKKTRFVGVRYGNVLASRGSVIPLFHDLIRKGGPVTITTPDMTRFLLSLDSAVDTVLAAVQTGLAGEIYIPRAASARVMDIAEVLIGERPIEIRTIGIRPGEKIHEVLVSEEEIARTVDRGGWFAIEPMLPELCQGRDIKPCLTREFTSADNVMNPAETAKFLKKNRVMVEDTEGELGEILR